MNEISPSDFWFYLVEESYATDVVARNQGNFLFFSFYKTNKVSNREYKEHGGGGQIDQHAKILILTLQGFTISDFQLYVWGL